MLNPAFPAPIVGPTCSVTLSFHDGSGNRVKAEAFTLKAGESRYALATVPLTGPTDQPSGSTCSLITTMEVVDPATGTRHGEFCPGEPYIFFRDPDGYEVEIWHELPTPSTRGKLRSMLAALWSVPAFQSWYSACGSLASGAIAQAIRATAPPANWYSAAFRTSQALRPLFEVRRKWAWNGPLSQAVFVNRVLSLLTRTRQPFDVPWTAEGLDLAREAARDPRGLIFCSAHLPLIKIACRALMDSGIPIGAVITNNPSVTDSLPVWGRTDRIPAIRAGRNVLLRTRSRLRRGSSVLLLADGSPGAPLQANIFRLAERLGSRMILFSAALRPDGVVAVRFFEAPAPSATSRMAALRAEVDRIRRAGA